METNWFIAVPVLADNLLHCMFEIGMGKQGIKGTNPSDDYMTLMTLTDMN